MLRQALNSPRIDLPAQTNLAHCARALDPETLLPSLEVRQVYNYLW